MKNRSKLQARFNITDADMAAYEVIGSISILSNVIPSAFWLLYYVFADSQLLGEIRSELNSIAELQNTDGALQQVLEVSKVKASKKLVSVFHESLRLRSFRMLIRMAKQDVLLEDRCLVKKGSVVQIPLESIHSTSSWGQHAQDFDSDRFFRETTKELDVPIFGAFGMAGIAALADILLLRRSFPY